MTNKIDTALLIKGHDLRKMRLHAKKTTVQMAGYAGVKTRKTYENWEKDLGQPNVNQFIALCVACHINSAMFVEACVKRNSSGSDINLNKMIAA